jgi:peptidoglycan/LPS O-acetylase OafA/YrhL
VDDADELQDKRGKLLYLESLRGLAAMLVVFSHYASAFYPASAQDPAAPLHSHLEPWLHNTPLGLLLAGNFGVCIFFVMSGYVLVRPFFLSKRHELLVSAAVRRYLRLMPPVAVSVLAAYVLLKLHLFTNQALVPVTGSAWLQMLFGFTAHLHDALYQAFVGAFLSGQATYNPLLWTMTTEFLGSMLIFGIAALVGWLSKRWIFYAALMLVFARSYYLGFICGLVIADYLTTEHGIAMRARLRHYGWYLASLLVGGLLLGAYPADGHADVTWYHAFVLPMFSRGQLISFWHTMGALLVVGSILMWPRMKGWLSAKWLVGLGEMSFSIYLTHMLILCTVVTAVFARVHLHMGYGRSFALTFFITLPFILGVSYFYTRYVDGPAIRGARRFGKWVMRDKEAKVANAPAGARASKEASAA